MKLKAITAVIFIGILLTTPAIASDNGKAEVEKWKAEAKKWESIAKHYEAQYGWINASYGWCSMNRSVSNLFGYDASSCSKPLEPYCNIYRNCSEWEIQSYKSELEDWIMCRKNYIREAQDDAGCALMKIKEQIDKVAEGE